MNICCFKSFKVHSVRVFIHMVVIDHILAEAFAEDIGIRTVTTLKEVIARTADQGVVAVFSIQSVITRSAIEDIIALIGI